MSGIVALQVCPKMPGPSGPSPKVGFTSGDLEGSPRPKEHAKCRQLGPTWANRPGARPNPHQMDKADRDGLGGLAQADPNEMLMATTCRAEGRRPARDLPPSSPEHPRKHARARECPRRCKTHPNFKCFAFDTCRNPGSTQSRHRKGTINSDDPPGLRRIELTSRLRREGNRKAEPRQRLLNDTLGDGPQLDGTQPRPSHHITETHGTLLPGRRRTQETACCQLQCPLLLRRH